MRTVANILETKKSTTTISVAPENYVYQALELMVEKNVSAVLVMENEKLAGIFTERDYARKVVLKGKSSKETPIREVMTADLVTVTPDGTIEECMLLMTNKFIRHLPVVADNKLLGIISIGDVVKYIIDDQKFIIENLEQYITGR